MIEPPTEIGKHTVTSENNNNTTNFENQAKGVLSVEGCDLAPQPLTTTRVHEQDKAFNSARNLMRKVGQKADTSDVTNYALLSLQRVFLVNALPYWAVEAHVHKPSGWPNERICFRSKGTSWHYQDTENYSKVWKDCTQHNYNNHLLALAATISITDQLLVALVLKWTEKVSSNNHSATGYCYGSGSNNWVTYDASDDEWNFCKGDHSESEPYKGKKRQEDVAATTAPASSVAVHVHDDNRRCFLLPQKFTVSKPDSMSPSFWFYYDVESGSLGRWRCVREHGVAEMLPSTLLITDESYTHLTADGSGRTHRVCWKTEHGTWMYRSTIMADWEECTDYEHPPVYVGKTCAVTDCNKRTWLYTDNTMGEEFDTYCMEHHPTSDPEPVDEVASPNVSEAIRFAVKNGLPVTLYGVVYVPLNDNQCRVDGCFLPTWKAIAPDLDLGPAYEVMCEDHTSMRADLPQEQPYEPEPDKDCDKPDMHDPHDWHNEGIGMQRCGGVKAHPGTQIGKTGTRPAMYGQIDVETGKPDLTSIRLIGGPHV